MKHNTPAQEAKNLGTLFFTFFKIGLFTFGGGYAMIALLEEEFIQRRRWLDKDEFLDMTAIAESTPGPVAINSATYLGYKLAGVLDRLGVSRFSGWTTDCVMIRDRAGWGKQDDRGGRLYLFTAEGLREALKGFDFPSAPRASPRR